ncbi:MAG: ABC transporter ATP-binding protein [Methanomicrobiales archaeon]|jgi:energy-coupling factor transport system ATP-binding protein|nr:ABC transporter ATP-binding protein [Methanomicrobiales archaeon]
MIEVTGLVTGTVRVPYLAIPIGITVVMGPNGGGKTTLLATLAGVREPAEGTVQIDGTHPRQCEVGWVGEVPERQMIFSRVFDEIAAPLRFRCRPCPEVQDRVRGVAGSMGIAGLLERDVRELSGGERILVALATALVAMPVALILDEADTHLDWQTAREVMVHAERSGARYLLVSTHDSAFAWSADSLIIIRDGKVWGSGPPHTVFEALGQDCLVPLPWEH